MYMHVCVCVCAIIKKILFISILIQTLFLLRVLSVHPFSGIIHYLPGLSLHVGES